MWLGCGCINGVLGRRGRWESKASPEEGDVGSRPMDGEFYGGVGSRRTQGKGIDFLSFRCWCLVFFLLIFLRLFLSII